MTDLLTSLDGWTWVIGGLILMAFEAVVPGVFLVWFGGAAIGTGLISVLFDLSLTAQFLTFAALATASVMVGWKYGAYAVGESDRPNLNIRGQQYIGRSFDLDEAIVNGRGRMKVGDTTWRIHGPDLTAGTKVTVTGVKGASLIVEAITD